MSTVPNCTSALAIPGTPANAVNTARLQCSVRIPSTETREITVLARSGGVSDDVIR